MDESIDPYLRISRQTQGPASLTLKRIEFQSNRCGTRVRHAGASQIEVEIPLRRSTPRIRNDMPEMDGLDTAIAIRGEFPLARVIVLTVSAGDVQVLRAIKAGAPRLVIPVGAPPAYPNRKEDFRIRIAVSAPTGSSAPANLVERMVFWEDVFHENIG